MTRVWKNDGVEIIANDQGNRTTPSYVAFTDTERLIGDAAKNQVARNPENTVSWLQTQRCLLVCLWFWALWHIMFFLKVVFCIVVPIFKHAQNWILMFVVFFRGSASPLEILRSSTPSVWLAASLRTPSCRLISSCGPSSVLLVKVTSRWSSSTPRGRQGDQRSPDMNIDMNEYLTISQISQSHNMSSLFPIMLIYILYSTRSTSVTFPHMHDFRQSTASCDKLTIYNLYFQFSLLCRRRSSTQRKSLPWFCWRWRRQLRHTWVPKSTTRWHAP